MFRKLSLFAAVVFFCSFSQAATAGGACPTGANYVNIANEGQSGTMQVTLASLGVTSCYYVGVSGQDSNSGTSESAPFLHIPGTPNFTGSAALGAGVGVIVEGGYVAHFGNGGQSTSTGGKLTVSAGGNSGSPLYFGIDPTWYSGSSFARPVFTGDNPLSTSFVSSCAYDQGSLGELVNISGGSNIILDGFESTGLCWSSGSPNIIQTSTSHQNVYVERWYDHGWTTTASSTDSRYLVYDTGSGVGDGDIIALNVVDGSDSSAGAMGSSSCQYSGYTTHSPCYSGGAVYEGGETIWGNVFQHLSNVAVTTNNIKWHDNYINNLFVTYQNGGQHTNCDNNLASPAGSTGMYFYNNRTTNVQATECYYLATPPGGTIYGFNNVFWGNMNYILGSAASNCVFMHLSNSGSGTATLYWVNNTMDATGGGCEVRFEQNNSPLYAWNGPAYFQNTHAIGYSTLSNLYTIDSTASATVTDKGGQVYETESAANSQGYTTSNNYAPTSTSGASYHAGVSGSSFCSSIADANAKAACNSGTSGGVNLTSGWGGEVASYPAITVNARGSSWDAGAYQFSGSSLGTPVNLTGNAVPK